MRSIGRPARGLERNGRSGIVGRGYGALVLVPLLGGGCAHTSSASNQTASAEHEIVADETSPMGPAVDGAEDAQQPSDARECVIAGDWMDDVLPVPLPGEDVQRIRVHGVSVQIRPDQEGTRVSVLEPIAFEARGGWTDLYAPRAAVLDDHVEIDACARFLLRQTAGPGRVRVRVHGDYSIGLDVTLPCDVLAAGSFPGRVSSRLDPTEQADGRWYSISEDLPVYPEPQGGEPIAWLGHTYPAPLVFASLSFPSEVPDELTFVTVYDAGVRVRGYVDFYAFRASTHGPGGGGGLGLVGLGDATLERRKFRVPVGVAVYSSLTAATRWATTTVPLEVWGYGPPAAGRVGVRAIEVETPCPLTECDAGPVLVRRIETLVADERAYRGGRQPSRMIAWFDVAEITPL